MKVIGDPGASGINIIISDGKFWFHQRIFLLPSPGRNGKIPVDFHGTTYSHHFSIAGPGSLLAFFFLKLWY